MTLAIVYGQIGKKINVTQNPTSRDEATCRIHVSEDIVLPPSSEMVVKGELMGETSMANGLLEPCSEKSCDSPLPCRSAAK